MNDDRRHFKRVQFDQDVLIKAGAEVNECQLLDISLKGALVDCDRPQGLTVGSKCDLHMELSGSEISIDVQAVVCYNKHDQIGIQFHELSLDSLTHLRRLVELNLGDTDEIRRELFFIVEN